MYYCLLLYHTNVLPASISSTPHVWMAGVDLEVRRLGGVLGVLKLLRPPVGTEPTGFCADRIELGAAILACKVKNIPPEKTYDGSSNMSSMMRSLSNVAEEEEGCGEQELVVRHYQGKETGTPWETRALIAALDALQGLRRIHVLTDYCALYDVGCRCRQSYYYCTVYTHKSWRRNLLLSYFQWGPRSNRCHVRVLVVLQGAGASIRKHVLKSVLSI